MVACTALLAADARFPIMPWNHVPDDPAVFAQLRDAGFSVAGFVPPAALDHVQAAGLQAIVSDRRASGYDWTKVNAEKARAAVAELIEATARHPAVIGYYLTDEPGAEKFAGLAIVADAIRNGAPGRWPYINLFPNYANARQLGTADYATYLDTFITTCRPTILSYDNYAPAEDGSFRTTFWSNLEHMRAAARRAGIPFWNIMLSEGCVGNRVPTDADLRLQAYASLAYGAQGLTWFQYFAAPVGNFRGAPIDQFGQRTPMWDLLRNVNQQVQKLAPTLLKLRHDDTYHFEPFFTGTHPPTATSLLQDAGTNDVLAGDFTHEDGSRFLLIVNRDLVRSKMLGKLRFLTPNAKVRQVSPWSGQLHDFSGEHRWLATGAGVLLRID